MKLFGINGNKLNEKLAHNDDTKARRAGSEKKPRPASPSVPSVVSVAKRFGAGAFSLCVLFGAALAVLWPLPACDLPEKFPEFTGDISVGPFVKYATNPILPRGEAGAFDSAAVAGPAVIEEEGGRLRMYYGAVDAAGLQTIGTATSQEGLVWERRSVGPVLTPTAGSFDEAGVSDPSAIYDGSQYWVFFTGWDAGGTPRIGLASSGDGVTFEKAPAPIMESGGEGAYDSAGVAEPCAVFDEGRSKFLLYYTGYNQYGQGSIMLAVSDDGQTWTRYGIESGLAQPALGPATEEEGAFDSDSVGGPSVLFVTSREGRALLRLWYSGSQAGGSVHVGLAGSGGSEEQTGGYNWERYPANPVAHYARSPSVVSYGANLYMYYNELPQDESAGISLATRLELSREE
ncbi:MAG: hypothetical protein HY897_02305 [Deltaproteobacteria bacterium]|nr:hypothetical protein [Deltaproteobacteria bacterium]